MRTFNRYLLLQVPELAGLAVLLWLASAWLELLGAYHAVGLWLAFAALQLGLYPFVRLGYDDRPSPHGPEVLVAARGVATETLDPEGWVRVRRELWRARLCNPAEGPVEVGGAVRVQEVNDLTLQVRPERCVQSRAGPQLPSPRSRVR